MTLVLPKLICKFQIIPVTSLQTCLVDADKLVLNYRLNGIDHGLAQTSLESKIKVRGVRLQHNKAHQVVMVTKTARHRVMVQTCGIGQRNRKENANMGLHWYAQMLVPSFKEQHRTTEHPTGLKIERSGAMVQQVKPQPAVSASPRTPVCVLAVALLIQLPFDVSGKGPVPTWGTRMKLLALDFRLAQLWSLRLFGE